MLAFIARCEYVGLEPHVPPNPSPTVSRMPDRRLSSDTQPSNGGVAQSHNARTCFMRFYGLPCTGKDLWILCTANCLLSKCNLVDDGC
jgi:hypothetical protein